MKLDAIEEVVKEYKSLESTTKLGNRHSREAREESLRKGCKSKIID